MKFKKIAGAIHRISRVLLVVLLFVFQHLLYYSRKSKKNKHKTEYFTLKLRLNLLLLFLVTMTTGLKGLILCFPPHHEVSVPTIHHTFNAVYGVNLYNTNFQFLFDDVETNGLKELYKDIPKRLLTHMTDCIKQVSGALLRTGTEKVETLFGNIQISYQMDTGKFMNFKQGQELASGIKYLLKYQRPNVWENFLEIQFSTSRIYPSLVAGIVDGLNMDKLSSKK